MRKAATLALAILALAAALDRPAAAQTVTAATVSARTASVPTGSTPTASAETARPRASQRRPRAAGPSHVSRAAKAPAETASPLIPSAATATPPAATPRATPRHATRLASRPAATEAATGAPAGATILPAASRGRGSMRTAAHAHPGLGDSDFASSSAEAFGMCGQMHMPAAALREVSRGFRRGHAGIDLMAPHGSPAHAAAAGSVLYAGWYYAYGNIVDIRHADGVVTRYAHLSAIAPDITPGAMVLAGEEIGRVGATGRASGPHIHFEVRLGGRPVDPRPYLALASCPTPGNGPEILEAYAEDRPAHPRRPTRRPRPPAQ